MYLLERLKPWPMKTLYYGVLVAMVTTLSLSFLVFRAISNRMEQNAFNPLFEQFDELQLESARTALDHFASLGGRAVLVCRSGAGEPAAYLDVSTLLFPGHWSHGSAVLAGLGRRRVTNPQDSGFDRAIRTRRSFGARAYQSAR